MNKGSGSRKMMSSLSLAAPSARTHALPTPFASQGDTSPRAVARGGSCWTRPKDATFASRVLYRPWRKVHDVGFRILVED